MTLTPDQLRALAGADGTTLDLPLDSLGSATVSTVFGPFLTRLTLRDVTSRTATSTGVTVTGTGDGGPFTGMSVTAEFAAAEDVTLRVTATGDANWSFVTAFPALKGSLWAELRFTAPRLVLDSTTAAPADDPLGRIPMTFTGTMIVTTRMAVLDLLYSGTTHDLTGEITVLPQPDGVGFTLATVPSIALLGPVLAPGPDLGVLSFSQIRYELYALPYFNFAIADYDVKNRVVVSALTPVNVGGTAHEVGLYLDVAGWDDGLVFTADFSDLGPMSLEDVAGLFGQKSEDLGIPFGVRIVSPVVLTTVSVEVSGDLTVSSVAFKLETDEQWPLGGPFTLVLLDVVFRVQNPLTAPSVAGVVSGLVGIGQNGVLQLAADFGERSIGGSLREDDGPLNVREVYHDLSGGQDATHLPDLLIERFEVFGSLPADGRPLTFLAGLGLDGTWPITDDAELIGVGFDVNYGETVTFTARAAFVVGGVTVVVTAGYDPTLGWNFAGETGPGQAIAIGAFADELARTYGELALPAPLANLTIENLAVAVSTGNRRLFLTAETRFPIDTTEVALKVLIDTAARSYSGSIAVAVRQGLELDFTVRYAPQPEANRFAATYAQVGPMPTLKGLVGALAPSAAVQIPDGIAVGIRGASLAVEAGVYVFGIDLVATIDLARLPVIGPRLTGDQAAGFDPLRVIAATGALTSAQVKALNAIVPAGAPTLPEQDLATGFSLSGAVKLGPLEQPMTLPATAGQSAPTTPVQAQTGDNVLWYKVQTGLGPIQIARVGLAYRHAPNTPAQLAILLDASVSVGGLTLSCDGLAVGLSLADSGATPTFDLAGLGVAYRSGPVGITGAFLKGTLRYDGRDLTAYSGKAVLTTETFTLGALGSYAQLDDGPSLFVYAFLDYPIGGPAFFFVTGLAAGFGYNRRFVAPPVDRIADFPLVSEAIGVTQPGTLGAEMARLNDALQPSPGDYFLTVGVRFTSYQMIDSFLLVTAGFGHRFELDVLGLSTLVLPMANAAAEDAGPVTPIAEIQLALRAAFAPEDGYFSLLAQLTSNSYLLSKACRLTGGLAFTTWFGEEHPGDFVLTVGGYHPHFTVPSHYPSVPRLGFNWQVSDQLAMKGSAYYALTPGALMAGGSLSATYVDGSLRAWFDTALDFLIAWQPYHYEANFHLSVGASYTFDFFGTHTINAHVGTEVAFWGPEFGGTATIDLDVISFTIDFGSKSGASAQPVKWDRFRPAQLPADDKVVTIALRGGTPQGGSGEYFGAVDPATLELLTDSVLPSTKGVAGTTDLTGTGTAFGIAPMGVTGGFTITQTITITRDGVSAERYFRFDPVGKNLPAALWGDEVTPTLSKPALLENLLTGYRIRPLPPDQAGSPTVMPMTALQALTAAFTEENAFDWTDPPPFVRAGNQTLDLSAGQATRAAVAAKLLPGWDIDLHGLTPADFLSAPEVAAHG